MNIHDTNRTWTLIIGLQKSNLRKMQKTIKDKTKLKS